MIEPSNHRGTPQVLVVDDEPDLRLMLRLALRRDARFEVCGEAENGEVAVQMATRLQPDIILLDLMMPVMDGWQFRRAQQSDPMLAPIPVVVVSADASVQQRAAAIDAAGYLRKPIQLDTLLGTVARFCA